MPSKPLPWTVAVLGIWVIVMAAIYFQPAVPAMLVLSGLIASRWLAARITGDPVCVKLITWSYGLKVVLAGLLYAVSIFGWPAGSAYYGGDGFWAFADDGQAYHNYAIQVAKAWNGEGPFPYIDFGNWSFVTYLAWLYRIFGATPLNSALLNAWYGTAILLAAYVILRHLTQEASRIRLGVGLLAFWPSLVFWSGQSLKDPLTLALIMVNLAILVLLLSQPTPRGRRLAVLLGSLGACSLTLVLFRAYVGAIFGAVAILALGWRAAAALWRLALAESWRLLAVMGIVVLCVVWGTRIDLSVFARRFVPSAPAVAASQDYAPAASQDYAPLPDVAPPSAPVPVAGAGSYVWSMLTPEALNSLRRGFVSTGGYFLIDTDIQIHNLGQLVGYLPRALTIALFAPFPWQWFDTQGRVGVFRMCAAADMIVIYVLAVLFLLGLPTMRRRWDLRVVVLAAFAVLIALPMCLTVANVGTLFRLRLQFLLPFVLLVAASANLKCLKRVP